MRRLVVGTLLFGAAAYVAWRSAKTIEVLEALGFKDPFDFNGSDWYG